MKELDYMLSYDGIYMSVKDIKVHYLSYCTFFMIEKKRYTKRNIEGIRKKTRLAIKLI